MQGETRPQQSREDSATHLLLPHCFSHVVSHRPVHPIHTETAQNKQLLERGDVVVTQRERELLEGVEVAPLGEAQDIRGGINPETVQAPIVT